MGKTNKANDKYTLPTRHHQRPLDLPCRVTLIVQRTPKRGQQSLPLTDDDAVESIEYDGYVYRAIATNRDAMSDSALIHWYNQRGKHSENRIKELKHDFAGQALPCSDFKANELYFALCCLAYNLFALMRHLLPVEWESARVTTVRWRLYALAGKIVHHGRTWVIAPSELVVATALRHSFPEFLKVYKKTNNMAKFIADRIHPDRMLVFQHAA